MVYTRFRSRRWELRASKIGGVPSLFEPPSTPACGAEELRESGGGDEGVYLVHEPMRPLNRKRTRFFGPARNRANKLKVVGITPTLRRVFELSDLDGVLDLDGHGRR
jgi:hypothetical protein